MCEGTDYGVIARMLPVCVCERERDVCVCVCTQRKRERAFARMLA